MSYTQTSEFVSAAHPDRLADQVSAKLINEIYKRDGKPAHAAIEVFIVGGETSAPVIHIGGEATTTVDLESPQVREWILDAVRECGYTAQNQDKFGRGNVLSAADYEIQISVNRQSPDIAKGVGFDKGFNDQGIYFGYADNSNSSKLGLAYAAAKFIGEKLLEMARKSDRYGPDIKTLVSVKYKNAATPLYISDITVAIPHTADTKIADVREDIKGRVLEF
ncbi:MAG: hypothetical protein LBJ18_01595, partial [Rickettsiales bacterium]|nr:hypothetical protein [Rickettsiales bacterium]